MEVTPAHSCSWKFGLARRRARPYFARQVRWNRKGRRLNVGVWRRKERVMNESLVPHMAPRGRLPISSVSRRSRYRHDD